MTVKYPLLTEKSVNLIERENKFIFAVENNATKPEIKKAVEALYDVKVESVNTVITTKGEKRAFVKLIGENAASDLATKLNII